MTVAVVDTGVSTDLPALKQRVTAVGQAAADCVGHGSFVAGLIAASPSAAIQFAGVAPQARIIAARGTDERGQATPDSVAGGISAAVKAGAAVITVSPALDRSSEALAKAVRLALQNDAVVVAAATPDPPKGTFPSKPPKARDYFPAALPGVLSVVDFDKQAKRPQNALLPRQADLSAPGDGVISVGPRGKGHLIGSGASLAAAYAAGTAALVRSAHPSMRAAEVSRYLVTTAYPADVPRLDPYAAVGSLRDTPEPEDAKVATPLVDLPDRTVAHRTISRASLVSAAGVALVIAVAWAGAAVPRARARRRGQIAG
ncbi:S8 family serine peptidase [Streptomyces sp. NPDC026673]|uniref:S8 family serine peptidase n=1 Tax=Streptomyces sp. NPDC026673 TaxID=3155724 RepID=UPI003401B3C8